MKLYPKEMDTEHGKAIFLFDSTGKKISWLNDIPLQNPDYESDEFNMVLEISQNTTAKMEINLDLPFNPIMQQKIQDKDGKKIVPREYPMFPLFNYGTLPQTYESHKKMDHIEYGGDGDPIDVLEVSGVPLKRFEVYKVRILGA